MKKFIFPIIFLLIVGNLLLNSSCKKSISENSLFPENNNLANRETEISAQWGEIHNQAMDDLFQKLENNFSSGELNQNSSSFAIRTLLNNHTQQYLTERCSETSLYPQFKFFQVLPDGKNYLIKGDTVLKENLYPYAMAKWGDKLSNEAKRILNEIYALASDETISGENTI